VRTSSGKGAVAFTELTKTYRNVTAVRSVSLAAQPGEFVTLLGPSGSGKTTTLRIVAGFIQPDSGSVMLDHQEITRLPPYKREMGMVFQNYALFPHMTAEENIAFPLQMRRVKRRARRAEVERALELVHLQGLGGRHPRELSGGQQQRVALARAIVFRPQVLLMDEPLGALDRKMREALQLEIMRVGRELGVTVLYVTHDQEEALTMSDRIAIYRDGQIDQLGTARDLYERPSSLFVARFVGESTIFRGILREDGDGPVIVQAGRRIRVGRESVAESSLPSGSRAVVILRPEHVRVTLASVPRATHERAAVDPAQFRGTIAEVIYLGSTSKLIVELEDGTTAVARQNVSRIGSELAPGSKVELGWDVDDGVVVREEPDEAGTAGQEGPIPDPERTSPDLAEARAEAG